ncbi:MAG: LysM peptidoglycan-binding domain-containing protein [Actinomycetota bacterium]
MRTRSMSIVIGLLALSACGGDDTAGVDSLPLLTAAPATAAPSAESTTTLPAVQEYYTIQQGDTLFGIAKSFGVTLEDLIAFNGIADPDAIEAGQRLKIPPVGVSIPTVAPSTTTTTTP